MFVPSTYRAIFWSKTLITRYICKLLILLNNKKYSLCFRIRQEKNGGAWCPKAQISSEVREYLEIDLDEDHLVTWTETQGRWGNGQGQEFTEAFTIDYWRQSINRWVEYKDSKDNKVPRVCILYLVD